MRIIRCQRATLEPPYLAPLSPIHMRWGCLCSCSPVTFTSRLLQLPLSLSALAYGKRKLEQARDKSERKAQQHYCNSRSSFHTHTHTQIEPQKAAVSGSDLAHSPSLTAWQNSHPDSFNGGTDVCKCTGDTELTVLLNAANIACFSTNETSKWLIWGLNLFSIILTYTLEKKCQHAVGDTFYKHLWKAVAMQPTVRIPKANTT